MALAWISRIELSSSISDWPPRPIDLQGDRAAVRVGTAFSGLNNIIKYLYSSAMRGCIYRDPAFRQDRSI